VLFLQANQLLGDWQANPQEFMTGQPP
jgi:hypothetical protein